VHQETFGKTGCRRIVPGEYLAVDPNGRACMIAAIEKQKFVYIFNRDSDQKLTISSPLEAHKANTIVYDLGALDVGFENPLFAAIEASYDGGKGTKSFTIYEMDLGINHVVRKYAEPIPSSSNMLIPIPGGTEGPGGCLICSDATIAYKRLGRESLSCNFPRRVDCPLDSGVMVVSVAKHKMKDFFLLIIQTELGDLFRVELVVQGSSNGPVEDLRIAYMDTIPRCTCLNILKSGFLFAASEFGNHSLYQFKPSQILDPRLPNSLPSMSRASQADDLCVFSPHLELETLEPLHQMSSLCPLVDMLAWSSESSDQLSLLAACGRGSNSTLRCLKLGVGVQELAATDLPGKPSGVWTLPNEEGLDSMIVISFIDATLVLAVGETVQEITDSGLLGNIQTLRVEKLSDSSLLQVHLRGLRQIHESSGRVTEWRAPGGRQVVAAATNSRQAVVALTGGDLVYFELSSETSSIEEVSKREMGCELTALSLGTVPEGRTRSLFVAASGVDRSVRVLSLEPDKLLKQVSAQSFQASSVESLVMTSDAILSIGLTNGTLVRCSLDRVSGLLSDPRARFLGTRPVRLFRVKVESRECVVALSSKAWMIDPSTVGTVPIAYDSPGGPEPILEFSAGFNSELCPDGLVAITGSSLRIVTGLDQVGCSAFAEHSTALSYTPRKLLKIPNISSGSSLSSVAVLETDKDALPVAERQALAQELGQRESVELGSWSGSARGRWASCVRIVDPSSLETRSVIEMDERNEAATCMSVVRFYQLKDKRPCLVVGTAVDQQYTPVRKCAKSFIKTYLYDENFVPQLAHATPVDSEGVPLAMCEYEGRLLVSLSPTPNVDQKLTAVIRLYELGKKRLLKKTEYRNTVCGGFVSLQVVKDRIFAADTHQSIHVLKLNKVDGQLYVVCDDMLQRYMSCMLVLDYNTIIGADKFDNMFVSRVPPEVREEQPAQSSLRLGPDTAYILGKTQKMDLIDQFHLGDTITSLHKVSLAPGASEVILYSTLSGAVGVLYPFTSKKEYELFLSVESNMRSGPTLVGRDHAAFRGYYLPAKGVVDGDLINSFGGIGAERQTIAEIVGKSANEIDRAIEEIKNRIT
jgi:splicing factor 3B subunit 3